MKKLYSSVIALGLIVALFSTVAYAWLAMATVNTIEGLSLEATSGNYLEISLDGENYSQNLERKDILNKISDVKFKDVTSNDGKNFLQSYSNPHKALVNKDYMSLNFYFRTTSQYREIHLSDNIKKVLDYENPPDEGTYITSKGVNFKSDVRFRYSENRFIEAGELNKFYAKDAMRVAIMEKDLVTKELGNAKIFDLSGNEKRGFGKEYGAVSYLREIDNRNINPPSEIPETIYKLSTFSEVDPFALSYESRILTLEETEERDIKGKIYYKGAVKMNVWLEGWDADAFDAIYQDQLKMQFTFKAVMINPEESGDVDD